MIPPYGRHRPAGPRAAIGAAFGTAWQSAKRLFSSQLRVNVASGFATTALSVLILAISYPLYLHFLGYRKVGVWLLLTSVQNFAQLGVLGIGPALTKLVAEERGRGDDAGAQRYVSLATALLSVTGTAAVLSLWALRAPVVRALGLVGGDAEIALRLLPFVGMLTALTFINQIVTAALAGVGRIDVANYCATAGKVAALTLEAVLLWRGVGVVALLLGDVIACCLIQVAGHVYLHRRTGLRLVRGNLRDVWDAARFRRLMGFGGSVLLASLTGLLIAPLDKLALSRYAGVALVPVFDIAVNGCMYLRSLAEVGLRALMPAVSHWDAAGSAAGRRDIRRLQSRAFRSLVVLSLAAYGPAVLLAGPLLKLWLRGRYLPQLVPAFRILGASALVSLVAVPAYYVLMGTGKVRGCVASHLVAAAANILFLAAFLAFRGTVTLHGAAFAVLSANAASSAYLLARARVARVRPAPRGGDDGSAHPAPSGDRVAQPVAY